MKAVRNAVGGFTQGTARFLEQKIRKLVVGQFRNPSKTGREAFVRLPTGLIACAAGIGSRRFDETLTAPAWS
jgi:hypothetical protein